MYIYEDKSNRAFVGLDLAVCVCVSVVKTQDDLNNERSIRHRCLTFNGGSTNFLTLLVFN